MAKPKPMLLRIVSLLGPVQKKRLVLVLTLSFLAALIDVIGVGSVAPFIAVASRPEVIQDSSLLHWAYQTFGFSSSEAFLWALGLVVIAVLLFTNALKALTRFALVRFTSSARHHLTVSLMRGYLRQDYAFFLNRNSHEFVKNVNSEVQTMVQGSLMTFGDLVGYILQVSLLVTLLMVTNPLTTLMVAIVVAVVYGTIYVFLRGTVRRLGRTRFDLNRERGRIVSETFWGIKDTKVLGTELEFLRQYAEPSAKLAVNESRAELAGDVPKFALESFAFSAIVLFVLVTAQAGGFQNAVATVGLFAFAAYRMIPAMQNMLKTLNKMRYSAPATQKITEEFEEVSRNPGSIEPPASRMVFERDLTVSDLSFTYPQTERPVLSAVSFHIRKNQTVGFAGPTGSGKTTLIDILLGLLEPSSGTLAVDGVVLDRNNRRSWQAGVGYVPQAIYLSNASVAQNIAFGVSSEDIDYAQVERAARMAQIHDFVVTGLKDGYHTEVGERGVRLSGGQRQRLGIARALYRNPAVLVFDEATSALDTETETAVMQAVNALSGQLTVLMIAHRLTTLRECHKIYLLENGAIRDEGTFTELSTRHRGFQDKPSPEPEGDKL